LQALESLLDRPFGPAHNPLRHLGALCFLYFWVILASGIYLYIFFDTGVQDAYQSVEALTLEQPWAGGVLRSLHRYASDAFLVFMLLHLLQEYLRGRYSRFRWFSWVSGVPLLWLALGAGIVGFWLVWDRLAQFTALATAEWLDALPLFSEPLVRNFLYPESVNDRFFSLTIFLHIGVPLFLLLGAWVHVQRIAQPEVSPPWRLTLGTLLMLLVLALVQPVLSHAPADLATVPGELRFDWFYLGLLPAANGWPARVVWAVAGAATLLLAVLPWLRLRKPVPLPVAQVDLANCNGCGRCVQDCPYNAIVMVPRSDGRRGARQPLVLPDLCASCGICAGACPSSTPFRSDERLVTGIDMPQLTIGEVRERMSAALDRLSGEAKVLVFGCECAGDVAGLEGPGVAAVNLLCTGMLPPSFVEFALRSGADGVLVTGCRESDCAYRLGNQLTEQRFQGAREPHLRANVPRERMQVAWAARGGEAGLARELEDFRGRLRSAAYPMHAAPPKRRRVPARG
ncbi:MAG TPA: hydrogenase iron-sulfur subunit, partial [Burkholderiales bacterium]|nr:hydrogenase iron-sulfur subunit [Burkholderiales bacterium]